MVIIFKSDTKEIEMVEHNTMIPTLPANSTFEDQKTYYKEQGLDFVAIPQEMGGYIFYYELCFNNEGNFIGLQPKIQ